MAVFSISDRMAEKVLDVRSKALTKQRRRLYEEYVRFAMIVERATYKEVKNGHVSNLPTSAPNA